MRLAPLYLSSLVDDSKFSSPITRFQPLKSHFLMAVLPLLSPVFNGSRRFCLSFDVYFYAFCLAVSGILHCIQHQNDLHLAPKHTAFSTKIHCVQHQNAVRFAAYCTAFCSKQPKNWCKLRLCVMNIHIASIYMHPPFASKPTFARIDFLRQGERLVSKKGTHNVKICAENKTN